MTMIRNIVQKRKTNGMSAVLVVSFNFITIVDLYREKDWNALGFLSRFDNNRSNDVQCFLDMCVSPIFLFLSFTSIPSNAHQTHTRARRCTRWRCERTSKKRSVSHRRTIIDRCTRNVNERRSCFEQLMIDVSRRTEYVTIHLLDLQMKRNANGWIKDSEAEKRRRRRRNRRCEKTNDIDDDKHERVWLA